MSDETEPLSTPETEQISIEETSVESVVGDAFAGKVQDAEKVERASNPWANWSLEAGDSPPGETETSSDSDGADFEEEKPKGKRGKLSDEEKEARRLAREEKKRQRAEEKKLQALALVEMADNFYVTKTRNVLSPLLNPPQLEAELENQKLKPEEKVAIAQPLAELMAQEDIELPVEVRLAIAAFVVYQPRLSRVKQIREALSPENPNEGK